MVQRLLQVFQEGLGLYNHTKATLKLMPNAQLVFHPKQSVPLAALPMVNEELKQSAVLKPDSYSKWTEPIAIV
ncbi:unnamed protein product [Hymenolepis diminuta]|uniref:RT_RNaseH_2 domain-containing protein n=1 Tax=Hymenolepis diminuta TaxID=6216 RepID=A0A0R3SYH7_HYMDI|nr:unnamed protein product [Hymenolepis diminuta]